MGCWECQRQRITKALDEKNNGQQGIMFRPDENLNQKKMVLKRKNNAIIGVKVNY